MKKFICYVLLIFSLITFFSCSKKEEQQTQSPKIQSKSSTQSNSNTQSKSNTQSNNNTQSNKSNYKYNYRSGNSSPYEYNYDVSGYDENGNSVNGNVDIQGKYGYGYILDEDGNEIPVDVEWIDYGEMEGTDEEGNVYELETE